jgi:hypothetical protein
LRCAEFIVARRQDRDLLRDALQVPGDDDGHARSDEEEAKELIARWLLDR